MRGSHREVAPLAGARVMKDRFGWGPSQRPGGLPEVRGGATGRPARPALIPRAAGLARGGSQGGRGRGRGRRGGSSFAAAWSRPSRVRRAAGGARGRPQVAHGRRLVAEATTRLEAARASACARTPAQERAGPLGRGPRPREQLGGQLTATPGGLWRTLGGRAPPWARVPGGTRAPPPEALAVGPAAPLDDLAAVHPRRVDWTVLTQLRGMLGGSPGASSLGLVLPVHAAHLLEPPAGSAQQVSIWGGPEPGSGGGMVAFGAPGPGCLEAPGRLRGRAAAGARLRCGLLQAAACALTDDRLDEGGAWHLVERSARRARGGRPGGRRLGGGLVVGPRRASLGRGAVWRRLGVAQGGGNRRRGRMPQCLWYSRLDPGGEGGAHTCVRVVYSALEQRVHPKPLRFAYSGSHLPIVSCK